MNGVMIRDVVFEQMYQKKIETIVDRAFYDGLMQGMSSVVAMVDHLQQQDPNLIITAAVIREHLSKFHLVAKEMTQDMQSEAQSTSIESNVESNNVIKFPPKKK